MDKCFVVMVVEVAVVGALCVLLAMPEQQGQKSAANEDQYGKGEQFCSAFRFAHLPAAGSLCRVGWKLVNTL